jgi:ketosteroid isomerase-like protein
MTTNTEHNKEFVLEYMQAFGTFDPAVYDAYLAENPTYMAGMNIRQGREAFHANTDAGKLLYPRPDEAVNEHIAVIADGDWVAVLLKRRAPTNKVENYENIYGMFFEVKDGKIHTQVELMDFRVSTEMFDLSVLPRR